MALVDYALIKDNVVVNALVFENPTEELLEQFRVEHGADLIVELPTKYGIGSTWSPEEQKFTLPKPAGSWILNDDEEWVRPIPMPVPDLDNGIFYVWSDEEDNWVEMSYAENPPGN